MPPEIGQVEFSSQDYHWSKWLMSPEIVQIEFSAQDYPVAIGYYHQK